VLPVYGCWEYVKKTLRSLSRNTDSEHYSLFIIHNPNSIDDGRLEDLMKTGHPQIAVQRFFEDCYHEFFKDDNVDVNISYNEKNRGVSASWNQGLEAAKQFEKAVPVFDSFVILNSDVHLANDWLYFLRLAIQSNPKMPILVNPQLTEGDLPDGEISQNTVNCTKRPIWFGKAPGICGPCFFFSRSVLSKIGSFDTSFRYLWFEDLDFLTRLRAHGIQIVQSANSYVHHYGQKSSKDLDHMDDYKWENKRRFEKKWCVAFEGSFHSSFAPDISELRETCGFLAV